MCLAESRALRRVVAVARLAEAAREARSGRVAGRADASADEHGERLRARRGDPRTAVEVQRRRTVEHRLAQRVVVGSGGADERIRADARANKRGKMEMEAPLGGDRRATFSMRRSILNNPSNCRVSEASLECLKPASPRKRTVKKEAARATARRRGLLCPRESAHGPSKRTATSSHSEKAAHAVCPTPESSFITARAAASSAPRNRASNGRARPYRSTSFEHRTPSRRSHHAATSPSCSDIVLGRAAQSVRDAAAAAAAAASAVSASVASAASAASAAASAAASWASPNSSLWSSSSSGSYT